MRDSGRSATSSILIMSRSALPVADATDWLGMDPVSPKKKSPSAKPFDLMAHAEGGDDDGKAKRTSQTSDVTRITSAKSMFESKGGSGSGSGFDLMAHAEGGGAPKSSPKMSPKAASISNAKNMFEKQGDASLPAPLLRGYSGAGGSWKAPSQPSAGAKAAPQAEPAGAAKPASKEPKRAHPFPCRTCRTGAKPASKEPPAGWTEPKREVERRSSDGGIAAKMAALQADARPTHTASALPTPTPRTPSLGALLTLDSLHRVGVCGTGGRDEGPDAAHLPALAEHGRRRVGHRSCARVAEGREPQGGDCRAREGEYRQGRS